MTRAHVQPDVPQGVELVAEARGESIDCSHQCRIRDQTGPPDRGIVETLVLHLERLALRWKSGTFTGNRGSAPSPHHVGWPQRQTAFTHGGEKTVRRPRLNVYQTAGSVHFNVTVHWTASGGKLTVQLKE